MASKFFRLAAAFTLFSLTIFAPAWGQETIVDLSDAEKEAAEKGLSGFFTDDAMVAERYSGQKVKITMGSYENIKVTTPDDLRVAEEILMNR